MDTLESSPDGDWNSNAATRETVDALSTRLLVAFRGFGWISKKGSVVSRAAKSKMVHVLVYCEAQKLLYIYHNLARNMHLELRASILVFLMCYFTYCIIVPTWYLVMSAVPALH